MSDEIKVGDTPAAPDVAALEARVRELEAALKPFAEIYEGHQIWEASAIMWGEDCHDIVDYIIEMSWENWQREVRPNYYDNLRNTFKAAADALKGGDA